MKLKHISLSVAAMATFALVSCTADEPTRQEAGTAGGERLHARIQLFLPSSTRSETVDFDGTTNSEHGFEIGQTYENNVKNVTVALATYDAATNKYTPVAVSATSATPVSGFDEAAPVYSINFRQDKIVESAGKTVYIFAFCNAEGLLDTETDFTTSDFADKIMTISSAAVNSGPWANGNFLMANAPNTAIPYKTLPDETSLKRNYNSPEKALDLGGIDVARVVSRFDFKQNNGNLFPVFDVNETDKTDGKQMADVRILAMAPVNVASEYYLLPRVSDDGTSKDWAICGTETRSNWVVSPNFAEKNSGTMSDALLSKYIYQSYGHPYTDENYYKYTYLADFQGDDDRDENWGDGMSADQKSGYKIWRYVTENTLPAVGAQQKGTSTGVVFKAEITNPKAGSPLAAAMEAGKDVYSFNGVIYGDVVSLRKTAAGLDAANTLRIAFAKVFGDSYLETKEVTEGEGADKVKKTVFVIADADLADCTPDANAGTFKIHRATKEGGKAHYYMYYLYRNRHFDNGNPAVMIPMEFGTVRNNIYKLAVTNINEFGHPGDPKDDPDPEKPEDPDEDPKTYLKVSVRVVPWMVRVNNIEF